MPQPVTAVVPARNEETSIAACVESLLLQGEIGEVLVADDGSTDSTAAVVASLARRDARVRLVPVPPLAAGWVGKNHALAEAVRHARGEWLLFTDADTVHAAGGLGAALESARRDALDLVSFSPAQEMRHWYEKAVNPLVFRELERLYRFDEVNDPSTAAAAANGQYILVRRAAYEAAGGHAALGGEILEDVALARAVKRAGYRLRFSSGAGVVRTRMYRGFPALWEGWTKNLYLLFGRSSGRMLIAAGRILLCDVLPLAFFPLAFFNAFFNVAQVPLALWVGFRHLWYALRLRRAGEKPGLALYSFPGSVLFAALLLNSLLRHRLGRPLAWKGREYLPSPAMEP